MCHTSNACDLVGLCFQEGLGTLTGFKANIIVDPSGTPKYCKSHIFARQSRERIEPFSGWRHFGTRSGPLQLFQY